MRLIAGIIGELAILVLWLIAWPFVALDDRYGWTARGRRTIARRRHDGDAIGQIGYPNEDRTVVVGSLELAGPPVRPPVSEDAVLWWCAYALQGGFYVAVAGEIAAFDIVDESGRARVLVDDAKSWSGPFANRRVLAAPLPEWTPPRGGVDEWWICWLAPGTQARVSGRIRPGPSESYRDAADAVIGADAVGTPVIVTYPAESAAGYTPGT